MAHGTTPVSGKKTVISAVQSPASTDGRVAKMGRVDFGIWIATSLAIAMLVGTIAIAGIWDPVELRVADIATRIAAVLFHTGSVTAGASGWSSLPTLGELGRGELPFTSIALGFRIWGMHDWSGRLPLALWCVGALLALVLWARRYLDSRVAAYSGLVFCTMPLVFFQSRFMLGDAATVGTSTIAFVCLSFACIDSPRGRAFSVVARVSLLVTGLLFATVGVLSRGLGFGVAAPALAAAGGAWFSQVGSKRRSSRLHQFCWVVTAIVGGVAAVITVWLFWGTLPERGLPLRLLGTGPSLNNKMPTFDALPAQLGHGLFPWSIVAPFALARWFNWGPFRGVVRVPVGPGAAIGLFLVLNSALHMWAISTGAVLAFPAVAALAIVIAAWLSQCERSPVVARAVLVGAITLCVVFLADFDNLPDKSLAAALASDARLPASFKAESRDWLRACAALAMLVLLVTQARLGEPIRALGSTREVLVRAYERLRAMWKGQLVFILMLVETSLITAAVLVLAARSGLPLQQIRAMSLEQQSVLLWAWLLMPAIVVAAAAFLGVCQLFSGIFEMGFGLPRMLQEGRMQAGMARFLLARIPQLKHIKLHRSTSLAVGMCAAAALLNVGWSNRLGQQLSPRRALSRFDSLAKAGEPLGLLGVKPQITHYYSRQRPELLFDPEEAADWLLSRQNADNRWLLVQGSQFAKVNAAYRERCGCHRNVPVVDARSSEMLLLTNNPLSPALVPNPLDGIVLRSKPEPRQRIAASFDEQIQVLGWDLVSADGKPVAELSSGRKYQLQLFFQVVARPPMDWEVFVHIDGYGRRYNADHDVTQGRYPMTDWRSGDFIVDSETIELDPSFTPGNYELYFGFFKGSRRLDVTQGPQEDNRLLAGTIRVN